MIYTVTIQGDKNHTSDHKVEAVSPEHAIDLVLNGIHSDVKQVWCEDIHEIL